MLAPAFIRKAVASREMRTPHTKSKSSAKGIIVRPYSSHTPVGKRHITDFCGESTDASVVDAMTLWKFSRSDCISTAVSISSQYFQAYYRSPFCENVSNMKSKCEFGNIQQRLFHCTGIGYIPKKRNIIDGINQHVIILKRCLL